MNRVFGFAFAALLCVGLGFAGGWYFVTHKWQVQADAITAQADTAQRALTASLDSAKSVVRHDTTRVFRSIAHVDTLIQRRIDTAVVHQTDTVKITVAEAKATQDTIRACSNLLNVCTLALAKFDSAGAIWTKKENAYKAKISDQHRRAWLDRLKDMGTGAAISGAVTLLGSLVHH